MARKDREKAAAIVRDAGGKIVGRTRLQKVVYLLQVVVLWGLSRDRDRLAGAALACATFKPQMVLLFVPFLLMWALLTRRWQFLGAFAVVFVALNLVSFALVPGWIEGMLYQINLYPSYVEVSTPAWVVTQYMLGLGDVAEWIMNLFFYGLMLWAWYGVLVERREERLRRGEHEPSADVLEEDERQQSEGDEDRPAGGERRTEAAREAADHRVGVLRPG